jgi:hypothetical protein
MDRDVPSPSSPTTTLEQVQRWAPGREVVDAGFGVPGVELFRVMDASAPPPDGPPPYEVVAIVGGAGQPILRGDEAMRAVARATQDPVKLAEIALAVNRRSGAVLQAPQDDHQRTRGVTAPAIANGALSFWAVLGGPGLELVQGRLDLSTGTLELGAPSAGDDEAITNALSRLSGSGYVSALATLKPHCANPKVSQALFEAIARGAKEDLRARAAMTVEACGAAAVEPLIQALETDKSLSVRATAAGVLGRLGDPRAKPALEKASRDSDSYLASVAKEALQKLP